MIVAALESDTSCVILTNNIVPSPTIIAKASEVNIPLILVPDDTCNVARQIDSMDLVISRNETEKIDLIETLVDQYVDKGKI
jgi:BioD-like phosphotransacetylase family protein